MISNSRDLLRGALERDDAAAVDELLSNNEKLRGLLRGDSASLGRPPLAQAQSKEAADVLLKHGASAEKLGEWWAPGFFLRSVNSQVADYLVDKGAALTVHAASALGLFDRLKRMLDADPESVHKPGGDGATPLHFARDLRIAELLVARGARLDARDEDHNSTPVQWLIGAAPDAARMLLDRGAQADLFVAAALGDGQLCDRLIAEDPRCLSYRIGKPPIPGFGDPALKSQGGPILQWTLGFNSYAHQYAAKKGHHELARSLFDRSDPETQLLVACALVMRDKAEALTAQHPGLAPCLSPEDRQWVALHCWETNRNLEAVRLMLDVGFPVAHPEGRHGFSPLHNAAWGGFADLVELLIERGHPLEIEDPNYHDTPLRWALHRALRVGRHPDGDYERTVATLIDAGATWDRAIYPTGDAEIDRTLQPRL